MSGGPLPTITPLNQPYWDATAKGEVRLQHCNKCGANFRYVRDICGNCWSEDLGHVVIKGEGTVIAVTVAHIAPYESVEQRVPYALALVELPEGATMMTNIVECDPESVYVGQKVELLFEPRGDLQIPQFRPARAA